MKTVIGMFAEDAEVIFNGGVFRAQSRSEPPLSRSFPGGQDRPTGWSRRRLRARCRPATRERAGVAGSAGRRTPCSPTRSRSGTPFESETLARRMARLHGEGVRTWWEGGAYHVTYRKDVTAVHGRSAGSNIDTLARADYRSGRSYAQPISVSRFTTRFPADQQGPDDLV